MEAGGIERAHLSVEESVRRDTRLYAEPMDESDMAGLSSKEKEVLALFSQGLSYAQIGEVMGKIL